MCVDPRINASRFLAKNTCTISLAQARGADKAPERVRQGYECRPTRSKQEHCKPIHYGTSDRAARNSVSRRQDYVQIDIRSSLTTSEKAYNFWLPAQSFGVNVLEAFESLLDMLIGVRRR